jgi:hypothetical protein
MAHLGTPYVWGGGDATGPTRGVPTPAGRTPPGVGFDCSGLMVHAFAGIDIAVPHQTKAIWNRFGPPITDRAALMPGDMILLSNTGRPGARQPGGIHHIGLYRGHGRVLHAPQTGSTVSIVDNIWSNSYWSGQFIGAVRAIPHAARCPAARQHTAGRGMTARDRRNDDDDEESASTGQEEGEVTMRRRGKRQVPDSAATALGGPPGLPPITCGRRLRPPDRVATEVDNSPAAAAGHSRLTTARRRTLDRAPCGREPVAAPGAETSSRGGARARRPDVVYSVMVGIVRKALFQRDHSERLRDSCCWLREEVESLIEAAR